MVFSFHLKKTAAEYCHLLLKANVEHIPTDRTGIRLDFVNSKMVISICNTKAPGQETKFTSLTLEKICKELNLSTVSRRLKLGNFFFDLASDREPNPLFFLLEPYTFLKLS